MPSRKNFRETREGRQERALERQEERAKRNDVAQLKKLIAAGHGHCKEAKRLEDSNEVDCPNG